MCNSPQLWNCKAKLSIVWTLYSSKCTCARARLGLYCSCISTHRKKKSIQVTNKLPSSFSSINLSHIQAFIHAEEKPKDLQGVGAHRHRRARERETNERTNERTDGRTEVFNIRSNCGRRRGGGGRVREGYIELRQITADPGKVITKDSINV